MIEKFLQETTFTTQHHPTMNKTKKPETRFGVIAKFLDFITTTKMKDGEIGNMNIFNELQRINVLRNRVKSNQNQILDIYDPRNKIMHKLLVEMNDLLVEVDQIENEIEKLMEQL